MLDLEGFEIALRDLLEHGTLDLLLLLGEGDDLLILVLDLLQIGLDLLVDALFGRLSHGIIEFSHFNDKLVLPGELGVVEKVDHLLTQPAGIVLEALKLIGLTGSGEENAKVLLTLELVNSLLERLVDVFHLEMLLLNLVQIVSHFVDVQIVFVDDVLILIELGNVFKNKLVEVILHGVNSDLQLGDLGIKLVALVLSILVLLLGSSNLDLEFFLFSLKGFSLLLQGLRLLLELIKNDLLLGAETLMNEALFGLHALNLVEVGLKGLALFLDIESDLLVVLLGHLFSLNDHLLLHVENLLDVLLVNCSLADLVLDHGDDDLDLVDLLVERIGFPGDLAELLQELDTFHLRVVDEVHVLHLLGDELFLELGGVLVGGVYLTKILVVLIL